MKIILKKQAEKYLLKVQEYIRLRLQQGIEDIANGEGDIKRLTEINSRTNIKY